MQAYVRLFVTINVALFISLVGYVAFDSQWGKTKNMDVSIDSSSTHWEYGQGFLDSIDKSLESFKGLWVWDVSLEDVLAQVLKDTRVQSAHVSRIFPGTLRVFVTPKSPVLGMLNADNKIRLVAADGSLLPPMNLMDAPDVALLKGAIFKTREDIRLRVVELFQQIPEGGRFSQKNISEISYSAKEGFILTMTDSAIEVRIGLEDLGLKASRIERVMNYLFDQQLNSRVIDARFSKKVVVRLRNGT